MQFDWAILLCNAIFPFPTNSISLFAASIVSMFASGRVRPNKLGPLQSSQTWLTKLFLHVHRSSVWLIVHIRRHTTASAPHRRNILATESLSAVGHVVRQCPKPTSEHSSLQRSVSLAALIWSTAAAFFCPLAILLMTATASTSKRPPLVITLYLCVTRSEKMFGIWQKLLRH